MQFTNLLFKHLFLATICSVISFSVQAENINQCAFIQEQLNKLPASGGEVIIPAGTYICLAPIILNQNNISLRGKGSVNLILGKNMNAPLVIMGDTFTPPRPIHHVSLINLKLDGNKDNQQSECWGGHCDTGGTSVIRNNGITVRGVTNGLIKDVYIKSARSGGIVTEKGCYDLVVDNLTSVDNYFDGFAGYETSGARFNNLNLNNNRAAGISIDIRFNGNFFKDVKIEKNGDVGIFMRDSSSNIFQNVSIIDEGNHGVFLAQVEDATSCAQGNEFQNLSVLRANGFGFRLNNICEGNFLSEKATFIGNRKGCIFQEPGAILQVKNKMICQE